MTQHTPAQILAHATLRLETLGQQTTAETAHTIIQRYVTMWSAGLITDRELAEHISYVQTDFFCIAPADGDVDPNTGLRYGNTSTTEA
jgi:hypothetical protein